MPCSIQNGKNSVYYSKSVFGIYPIADLLYHGCIWASFGDLVKKKILIQ